MLPVPSVLAQVDVDPSTEGMPGAELIQQLLDWAQMLALWGSIAALLIGAAMYGLAREGGRRATSPAMSSGTGSRSPRAASYGCSNASGNRDDRHFPDGERFDVHRKIDHHLSFGYGVHVCLGAALARLEGRVALDEVLDRFPEWEVDWDNAEQARTSTVRGWEALPVTTT